MPVDRNLHHHPHPDFSGRPHLPVVGVVALGGGVGALTRYTVSVLWPNGSDAHVLGRIGAAVFPWSTLVINATGCVLMGVLTVCVKERFTRAPRLLNPALGTGFLGGYTTFSSYTDDTRRLFEIGRPVLATVYLVLTVAAALVGVALGTVLTRRLLGVRGPVRQGGSHG